MVYRNLTWKTRWALLECGDSSPLFSALEGVASLQHSIDNRETKSRCRPKSGDESPHSKSALVYALAALACVALWSATAAAQSPNLIQKPYQLDTGLTSRSISFENPTGQPGAGGKAASNLGVGRKGMPAKSIVPGQTHVLCDIAGPGTIRHIWVTTDAKPQVLRSLVLRAWWDGQEHPSIECPLGDFFGVAHGKVMPYQSAVHSVGPTGGMNLWLPMPFTKRAKITLTNEAAAESKLAPPLFYQIDFTQGDQHAADVGRMHVLFRRENPTALKQDFELLPKRQQKGRFIGSVIGIRNLHPKQWWGEGEIKVYLDGDKEFPTICGTGSEDYVGLAWGIQQHPFLYNGCCLFQKDFVTMYRWHLPDPIAWRNDGRVTIQQIAYTDKGLAETQDDWTCATFWYEPTPSAPLPKLPDIKARTANLWKD